MLVPKVPRFPFALGLLAVFIACGGTDSSGPSLLSVANVTITGTPSSLETGTSVRLSALATNADGRGLTRTFTWISSNTAVASVTNDGVVTGIAPGATQISASVDGKTGTTALTVSAPASAPVASITVSPANPELEPGVVTQFSAVVSDAAGNPITGRTIAWSSTNSAVASVDANGRVSANTAGTTEISAATGGKVGSTVLTVLPKTGLDISLSTPSGAQRFVIAIDGGGLPQPELLNVATQSGASITGRVRVSLAAGGPYRVRALAIDATASGPSNYSNFVVGATGKSEGVVVNDGARTTVSVALARPTIQVSAPAMINAGAPVTITWTYADPGDVLESNDQIANKPYGFLNYSRQSFIDGATSSSVVASATKVSAGVYQFSASFSAPASAGPLYFQTEAFALYAPLAEGTDKLGGYLFNPSSARRETLGTITIQ